MNHPEDRPGLAEDWAVLESFLPANWRDLAASTGALKGLCKDKSAENLLRVLLLHLGCGNSLQETALRARRAELADMTAAAVWNRLQKSWDWLRSLCVELFRERGWEQAGTGGFQIQAFNATTVTEPGCGSLWRIHSSVRLPSLACDFFRLTATKGAGTGESFRQFPLQAGDYLLADRGYSTAACLRHVAQAGAFATVRVNTKSLPRGTSASAPFDLLAAVRRLRRAGQIGCWSVAALDRDGSRVVGRICALRKTAEALRLARKALRLKPHTLEFARYVILFTTFPADTFPAAAILEWDRTRWQVELVFQRFQSLAQLGHLPKHTDASAKAWLYGKLLVALLVEKLLAHARSISPWGCRLAAPAPA